MHLEFIYHFSFLLVKDCDPSEPDFREQQCSFYDNVPFRGRYFPWVPYTQGKLNIIIQVLQDFIKQNINQC